MDLNPSDRDLIAKTILGEAGDQPPEGQAAVAHVIRNRLNSKTGEFANGSVPEVVLGRNQFEAWSGDNRERTTKVNPNSKAYKTAAGIVDDVWSGKTPDPTNGATYFYSPKDQAALRRPPPAFAKMPSHGAIGGHEFFSAEGPDLVSEWASKPAAGAAGSPAGAAGDDLVSEWAPKAKPAPAPSVVAGGPSGAMMPVPKSPEKETLGEMVARMTGESQGDSYTDTAKRLGLGAVRGIGNVADTLAQGIAYAGEKGAGALERAGAISPESTKAVGDWRSRVNAGIAKDRAAFETAAHDSLASNLGVIGGEIAGTAPLLATGGGALAAATRGAPIVNALAARPVVSAALRGAGAGAGANLLTSASSDEPLGEQMQGGALTGAVAGPLGRAVGKVGSALVGSGIDPEMARLANLARDKYGIPIRADQISTNPIVRVGGTMMRRLPFTGVGEQRAEQQVAFNRAIANEFGESADHITRPVIQRAKDRIGDVFDDVARRTGQISIDRQFVNDVVGIGGDAQSVLGRDWAPIKAQIKRISDRIDYGTNTLDADSYQSLVRKGTPLDRAMKSGDPNVRHYAGQLREALDDAMQRSAPADAVADLKKARYQWAMMRTVEPLAKTGDISPARVLGKSKGGNLEELGLIGNKLLPETSTSNTAEHLALMKLGLGLAGGVGGVGGAAYFDPEHFQRDLAGLGALAVGAKAAGSALKSNALTSTLLRGARRVPTGRNALQIAAPPAAALINRRNNPNALAAP